jgi:hypothetical protein
LDRVPPLFPPGKLCQPSAERRDGRVHRMALFFACLIPYANAHPEKRYLSNFDPGRLLTANLPITFQALLGIASALVVILPNH